MSCATEDLIEGVFEDVVTDETCGDRLREQDRRKMKEDLMKKSTAKAQIFVHTKHIQAYLKHEAESKPKKQPAKNQKPAIETEAQKEKQAMKWWHSVKGDLGFIECHRPAEGKYLQDDSSGRFCFLISYPGKHRNIFSWTSRGMEAASICALQHLWQWHTESTCTSWPLPFS